MSIAGALFLVKKSISFFGQKRPYPLALVDENC